MTAMWGGSSRQKLFPPLMLRSAIVSLFPTDPGELVSSLFQPRSVFQALTGCPSTAVPYIDATAVPKIVSWRMSRHCLLSPGPLQFAPPGSLAQWSVCHAPSSTFSLGPVGHGDCCLPGPWRSIRALAISRRGSRQSGAAGFAQGSAYLWTQGAHQGRQGLHRSCCSQSRSGGAPPAPGRQYVPLGSRKGGKPS